MEPLEQCFKDDLYAVTHHEDFPSLIRAHHRPRRIVWEGGQVCAPSPAHLRAMSVRVTGFKDPQAVHAAIFALGGQVAAAYGAGRRADGQRALGLLWALLHVLMERSPSPPDGLSSDPVKGSWVLMASVVGGYPDRWTEEQWNSAAQDLCAATTKTGEVTP